ncbi:RND family efflux transporter, MFP subunit [Pseudomonas sp. LAMO17WK12:I10]|uniref:efflux RND transporter periplasmic adaptor subunit n=1 Tax=unclassified Pseudomonas TaxID=196821 RepID=UPI000BD33F1B|nr:MULTISPECIES: efflux RND transporter periplasmic adaptor subunit [unclassified Pseudomonas]PXX53281.1 multidrug efflux system membrane fusion protein [Pseudomonas sp. LAMO17WK12:I9]SNY52434.1 RND family efflux transporter, MFP subunit [Pseudomonas sp. LAMO17WK12:I10]
MNRIRRVVGRGCSSTHRLGALCLLLALGGCNEKTEPVAAAAPVVEVTTVSVQAVREWDLFNGRISAIDAVDLRPRVSGYVDRVAFREGDEVEKGQTLFVIDPRPYREALASAQARLARARATVRLASEQDRRGQALVKQSALSREEGDIRSASLAQGVADVNAAVAEVATAQLNLDFTQVRAPFSGRVGRAMLTLGNLAQADQSILTSIVSQDPMYVYFDADEQSLLRYTELLGKGQRPGVSNTVRVGLANDVGTFPLTGTVDFLDNQVDPATGTIRVRAVLPNPERRLTAGLFARVRLEGGSETRAVLIDDRAVQTDQDRKYVYVIGPQNQALRKDVTLGRQLDGLRVISAGLAVGDRVVLNGAQKIFYPGMAVEPRDIAAPPQQAAAATPQMPLVK